MGWKEFEISVDDWMKINDAADEMIETMEEGIKKGPDEGFKGCTAEKLRGSYFECLANDTDKVYFQLLDHRPTDYMAVQLDYGHIDSVEFAEFKDRTYDSNDPVIPGLILKRLSPNFHDYNFDFQEGQVYELEPDYVRHNCRHGDCGCHVHLETESGESGPDYTFTCSHCNEDGSMGITDENGDEFCSATCLNEAHYDGR